MKKLLLILMMLVSVVSGAEKIHVVGDSKMGGTIMDTAKAHFIDTSRFINRSAPGYGWQNYDHDNDNPHWLDTYIPLDTATYILVELGLNNIWDAHNVTGSTYYNQIRDMELLDRWYMLAQAYGCKMGVIEMGPVWATSISDTANARILSEIKERNTKRREWCAYNNVYWIPTFDSLKTTNDRPNPTLHNADGIHYAGAGYDIVGRQIGHFFKDIPAKTINYTVKKSAKVTIPAYTSSKTLHHVLNLSKIKDTTFWNSAKPDGSNIALFINGVKTNRLLRDLVTYGNRGILEFTYAGAISTLELRTGNYNESNAISFNGTNLNRYYRLNEKKSWPTTIIDTVNGYNVSATSQMWTTYYNPATWNIYNDSTYKKTLVGSAGAQSSANTGMSSATKLTYTVESQFYDDAVWAGMMLFSIRGGGTDRFVLWINNAGLVVECGQYTNTVTIPVATARAILTKNNWHKIVVSMDLTQSAQADKVKIILDSTDVSSSQARAGTIGTSMPTFTDPLNIFGWYTGSYWPIGNTFKNVKFYTSAITPAEAIAEYKLQNSQFTITTISSTTGLRWSNFLRNIGFGRGR